MPEPPIAYDTRARDELMANWTASLAAGLQEAMQEQEDARLARVTAKLAAARAALDDFKAETDPAVATAIRALIEIMEEIIGPA